MKLVKKKESKKFNKIIFTCSDCGSDKIELRAWVDANTRKFVEFIEDDNSECYCNNCKRITFLKENEV